uniref:Heat shock protein 70 n=1 Tax=Panagrolaimus sp. PS1159 TaxID=55785 RepID=A0AC35GQ75_9BILA
MATSRAIGIDLGTTFSCVGVYEKGEVVIIENSNSSRVTPSVVAIDNDGKADVGQDAKNRRHRSPTNTIFGIKRLMGKKFEDPQVQEDIKNWQFTVKKNRKNGKASVEVVVKGGNKRFNPEHISAFILKDLKKTAEKYLGHKVEDAVITVPAYFNVAQRQATLDAAKIAKLNVLKLINEPTAAALGYGYKRVQNEEILLVFDLGGGTFDVSIIKAHDGYCEVLAVTGDDHLGGEDFDNILFNYCVDEFKKEHGDQLVFQLPVLCQLKTACEDAKRRLTKLPSALIEVDRFYENINLKCTVQKDKFTGLCRKLNLKTIDPIKRAMADANLTKNNIDHVILVGGSTRVPFVQTTIKTFFGAKKIKENVNTDEAVAIGATLCAAKLSGITGSRLRGIELIDVIPRSIGTDCTDNYGKKYHDVVIRRNTKIPHEKKETFGTKTDNQTEMNFDVLEGEDLDYEKSELLGNFVLSNITPAPAPYYIETTFKIDDNGILTVSAIDNANGSSNSIKLKPYTGRLTEAEIIDMADDLQSTADDVNDE